MFRRRRGNRRRGWGERHLNPKWTPLGLQNSTVAATSAMRDFGWLQFFSVWSALRLFIRRDQAIIIPSKKGVVIWGLNLSYIKDAVVSVVEKTSAPLAVTSILSALTS